MGQVCAIPPTTGVSPDELNTEVAALYGEYASELIRYAVSMLRSPEAAGDAVQETFLRYFVERSYGRLVDNPRAWLYRVLRNHILDRLDAASVRREVAPGNAFDMPDRGDGPEAQVWHGQMARRLVSALSPRETECLRLRADGSSYEEIAETLGVQCGTVSALLTRVYKKLRETSKPYDFGIGAVEALFALIGRTA